MKKTLLMAAAIVAAVTLTGCKSQKVLSDAAVVAEPAAEIQEVAAPITYTTPKRTTPSQTTPTTVSKPAETTAPVQKTTTTTTEPQTTSTPAPTPAPAVQKGDRQEKVKLVSDNDSGLLRDYNVVVGSFGSKENAENMKKKMVGRGYNSFLIQNESGMYRVVAGGYDSREDAVSVRDDIRSSYSTERGTCADAWLLIPAR